MAPAALATDPRIKEIAILAGDMFEDLVAEVKDADSDNPFDSHDAEASLASRRHRYDELFLELTKDYALPANVLHKAIAENGLADRIQALIESNE